MSEGLMLLGILFAGVLISAILSFSTIRPYMDGMPSVDELEAMSEHDRIQTVMHLLTAVEHERLRRERIRTFVVGILVTVAVLGFTRLQPVAERSERTAERVEQQQVEGAQDRCMTANLFREQERARRISEIDRRREELEDVDTTFSADGFSLDDIPGYSRAEPAVQEIVGFILDYIVSRREQDAQQLDADITRLQSEYDQYVVDFPIVDCSTIGDQS